MLRLLYTFVRINQESDMRSFNCAQCGAKITVDAAYLQPFIKCEECGSHEKIPMDSGPAPKYRVLDDKQRIRLEKGIKEEPQSATELDQHEEPDSTEKDQPSQGLKIAAPVIAAKKTAVGWPARPPDYRNVKKPLDNRKILIDALGKDGLEMVLEMVAGYLTESDESKKRSKKSRVIQTLMKSKITGELASQAVDYAEKCPETRDYLWANYKANLILGLGIFTAGVIISALIHFLAHPGRGFILFQLPFAVGFAYAVNAAINLAALKFPALRSDKIHYLAMTAVTALIVLYVIWGIYF